MHHLINPKQHNHHCFWAKDQLFFLSAFLPSHSCQAYGKEQNEAEVVIMFLVVAPEHLTECRE
jgi:hypothetical protein